MESIENEKVSVLSAPHEYQPPSVSLAYIIELAINQTYREFQILSELLKKKTGTNRKISILTFANSTRIIFLKLYALVKWAQETEEVGQLSDICYFLDQVSEFFVDTADSLFKVAKQELIFAGLPFYQTSHAADVLSLGSFPRLPESIKTLHITETPLTNAQKKTTLSWMNTMLNYRLTQEARNIPIGFAEFEIKNGMVSFTAPTDFKAYMTLQPIEGNPDDFDGDKELANWRWKVIKVDILIGEYDIVSGSSVNPPMRSDQLIEVCNSRIKHDLYGVRTVFEVLNEFTLKLQMDVLCPIAPNNWMWICNLGFKPDVNI